MSESEDKLLWQQLCAEVKPLAQNNRGIAADIQPSPEPFESSHAVQLKKNRYFNPPAAVLSDDAMARAALARQLLRGQGNSRDALGQPIHQAKATREQPRLFADMDGRSQHRFRRGKIKPQAVLDMHGLTEAEAAEAFIRFYHRALQRQHRCVLVVTGKGAGVLQRGLARWLEASAVRQSLVGVTDMPSHKGGSGAYALYLRHK